MASCSITDERKKVIDFSEPYGVVPVVVGGPKAVKVESPKDLAGKAIAVTRGTTSDQVITKSTKDVADVTIVRYQDDATTNTAVLTGQQKRTEEHTSEVQAQMRNTDAVYCLKKKKTTK